MCQVHELVLVEGRFGLGTHRGWDVSPGVPGKEEASNLWRGGETAANFGRRASRQGAGGEDKVGGGVAGGRGEIPGRGNHMQRHRAGNHRLLLGNHHSG